MANYGRTIFNPDGHFGHPLQHRSVTNDTQHSLDSNRMGGGVLTSFYYANPYTPAHFLVVDYPLFPPKQVIPGLIHIAHCRGEFSSFLC